MKGTAAGGGNALLMPMTELSLGLTGDINDIMNAHNLAMVALNARMQHERNCIRAASQYIIGNERVQFADVHAGPEIEGELRPVGEGENELTVDVQNSGGLHPEILYL